MIDLQVGFRLTVKAALLQTAVDPLVGNVKLYFFCSTSLCCPMSLEYEVTVPNLLGVQ